MEPKKKHLHAGHRDRLRARYRQSPETVSDHELLELLLYYAIPQKDTNALAHRLLDRFGDLSGVLFASEEQIRTVDGMGDVSSLLFPLMQDLFRRHATQRASAPRLATCYRAEDVADRYLPIFERLAQEKVMVIGLDQNFRIVGDAVVGEGTFDNCTIDMTRVCDFVTYNKPRFMVMAHNHPSGIGLPSESDMIATGNVKQFLAQLHVVLLDHLIFDGRGDYISFHQSKYMQEGHPVYSMAIREPESPQGISIQAILIDFDLVEEKSVNNLQNKKKNP